MSTWTHQVRVHVAAANTAHCALEDTRAPSGRVHHPQSLCILSPGYPHTPPPCSPYLPDHNPSLTLPAYSRPTLVYLTLIKPTPPNMDNHNQDWSRVVMRSKNASGSRKLESGPGSSAERKCTPSHTNPLSNPVPLPTYPHIPDPCPPSFTLFCLLHNLQSLPALTPRPLATAPWPSSTPKPTSLLVC